MTFEEFQSLCSGVVTTNTADSRPCPIFIGDEAAPSIGGYGVMDGGVQRELVVLKEQVPTAPMVEILNSCRFDYDAANNKTIIAPLTVDE